MCLAMPPCVTVCPYSCMAMMHMLTCARGVHVGTCTKMCVATVSMLTHASHAGNAQICAQWQCMCSPMPTRIYVHVLSHAWGVQACACGLWPQIWAWKPCLCLLVYLPVWMACTHVWLWCLYMCWPCPRGWCAHRRTAVLHVLCPAPACARVRGASLCARWQCTHTRARAVPARARVSVCTRMCTAEVCVCARAHARAVRARVRAGVCTRMCPAVVGEHTRAGCARRARVSGQRTRVCTCSPVPARVPHAGARGGARVPAVPACSGPCVGRPRRAAAPAAPSRPGLAAGAGPGPLAEARPGGAGGHCGRRAGAGERATLHQRRRRLGSRKVCAGRGALRLPPPGRAAGCSAGLRHPAILGLEEAMMHPGSWWGGQQRCPRSPVSSPRNAGSAPGDGTAVAGSRGEGGGRGEAGPREVRGALHGAVGAPRHPRPGHGSPAAVQARSSRYMPPTSLLSPAGMPWGDGSPLHPRPPAVTCSRLATHGQGRFAHPFPAAGARRMAGSRGSLPCPRPRRTAQHLGGGQQGQIAQAAGRDSTPLCTSVPTPEPGAATASCAQARDSVGMPGGLRNSWDTEKRHGRKTLPARVPP